MVAKYSFKDYSKSNRSVNKAYALIVAIVLISVYSYLVIDGQNRAIDSLKIIIAQQNSTILSQNVQIQNLEENVSSLKSTLSDKNSLISDLSNQLGLAESEISELTPITKNYFAVGVKSDGSGVVIPLEVKIRKGTGSISANIKNVDMLAGAQESIRTAVKVAQDFTGFNLASKDVEVTFKNNLPEIVAVDGPSAGSAITVTLIGVIQNKTLNEKILMTGTIEKDGSIGPVGSVKGKAEASRAFGATIFLVPVGQRVDVAGIQVSEVREISNVVGVVLK